VSADCSDAHFAHFPLRHRIFNSAVEIIGRNTFVRFHAASAIQPFYFSVVSGR